MRYTILLTLVSVLGMTSGAFAQNQSNETRQVQTRSRTPVAAQTEVATQTPVRRFNSSSRRVGSTPPLDSILPPVRQRQSPRNLQGISSAQRLGDSIPQSSFDTRSGGLDAMRNELPALDDFPYQAQDFPEKERIYRHKSVHNPDNPTSTWQQFAYDLGSKKKQADDGWLATRKNTDWNNPKNSDYHIYGKPVYAISSGVVVNCWRNAPDNPRPFSGNLDVFYKDMPLSEMTWLHDDTRLGKVHGSGNFIMVEEDNGNIVHYAHGRPGTVPKELCPNEGVLLSPDTWDVDSGVAAGRQVRVERGDFLFETGNAGTSSGPHLHLDRTLSDKATSVQIRFRNGLSKQMDVTGLTTTEDTWSSFKGQQIPGGPVLVWPPRREGGEWSWNRMSARKYGDYFAHMADSNYQIAWIDGYQVKKKPYFNSIWKPATAPWLAYNLLTGSEYQAKFTESANRGFAPVFVDSMLSNNQARYNVVFVKGASTDFFAHHGQSNAAFNTSFQSHAGEGYSPVSASVMSVKGKLRYTTLYRKQNIGGWVLEPGIRASNYQSVYNQNAAVGRRPYLVNAYKHKGNVYYSVAFAESPDGPRKDRHGMTPTQYQSEFNSAAGLLLKAVSGVDGASRFHRYIAIWR
ncbi:MAG: hypothetical protein AB8G18_01795 [Gammaproteobacteria bacterium]